MLFEFDNDGQSEIESMWVQPIGTLFRVDNIPFYVEGLAFGDIVRGAQDPDGALTYHGLINPSGHSTVRVVFFVKEEKDVVCASLIKMGCSCEGTDLESLIAVDVPPAVDYSPIQRFLADLLAREVADYQEACLRHHVQEEPNRREPDQG